MDWKPFSIFSKAYSPKLQRKLPKKSLLSMLIPKDGKIWLQYNGTEIDIAQKLVDRGVPKTDIVLGFQAPHRRSLTDDADRLASTSHG